MTATAIWTDDRYMLERNGPSIAAEMVVLAERNYWHQDSFAVVSLAYDRTRSRVFLHGTLKAAFRKLGSVADSTRGKLYRRDDFAACIVTPDKRVMNWTEAKRALGQ